LPQPQQKRAVLEVYDRHGYRRGVRAALFISAEHIAALVENSIGRPFHCGRTAPI
jgi:hypothetical protein